MISRGLCVWLASLALMGCGGGKEDEEGEDSRWQCHTDTFFDECYCIALGPSEAFGTDDEEVDECTDYAVCFSYFDAFFETDMCTCGDETYMPDDDAEDVTSVESCPE